MVIAISGLRNATLIGQYVDASFIGQQEQPISRINLMPSQMLEVEQKLLEQ